MAVMAVVVNDDDDNIFSGKKRECRKDRKCGWKRCYQNANKK